ncbi:UNVERIFIED_CONTAM: hypothetical protein PYX00_003533 [Menopon gallinae]|uniref:Homologous recombination OB-fold protein OB-fold domain-containing protein n=1 Tax=Menopon gallinae TaxID=328185 RepID=A0AAW2I241_9NEOP
MLDLENFDLELDEDLPAGPLNKSNLFENSISLPWSQSKPKEKTVTNCTQSEKSNNIDILHWLKEKNTDSPKPSQEKRKVVKDCDILDVRCDIFNTSIKNTDILDFAKDEINDQNKNCAKRILTHRKFPGPAGLLPDKPLKDLSDINLVVDNSTEKVSSEGAKESVILCSQTSSVFTEASYKKLISDFDMGKENCPLNKYTIDWIKKRAVKKSLYCKKIPFLPVILHNVDHSAPDPVLTLRDSTGEIYGILHREVWADLGAKLYPGAALALKQVGVLITGIARRQIYLNITHNNIINIYCYSEDDETVETNSVNQLNKGDILRLISEWESATPNVEPRSPVKPFTTIGGQKSNYPVRTVVSVTKNTVNNVENKNRQENKSNVNDNKTSISNFMEDDFNDFIASLDEDSISGLTSTQKEETRTWNDNIVRKRKINDFEHDSNSSNKSYCKRPDESILKCTASNEPSKFLLGSHPLSQAETQIVEEVLDGINFDDFD